MPSVSDRDFADLPTLRWEPTAKRVRAELGGARVVDTTEAILVWEPLRVVPSYAVRLSDLDAELSADPAPTPAVPPGILHPGIAFAVHSCPGEPVLVARNAASAAGFLLPGPELAEYVVLDFAGLDWWEESEPLVGHPHDPFSRIDVRASDRHVRVESEGVLLAESDHPTLVFETHLPTRVYLPRADLAVPIRRNDRSTTCAYKGHATYWTLPDGRDDLLWSYEEPLPEVAQLAGRVCFYQELVEMTVDGEPWGRAPGPVQAAVLDER